MKDQYINDKRTANTTAINDSKSKKNRRKIFSSVGASFFGALAAVTIFFMPAVGIASAAIAGLGAYHNIRNRKLKDQEIERLTKENEHLNSIAGSEVEKTPEIKRRRASKINSLNQTRNNTANKKNIFNNISRVGQVATVAGAAACCFLAPVFGWAALGGLATTALAGNKAIKENQKLEDLKLRINNLKNDTEVARIEEQQARQQQAQQQGGQQTQGQNTNQRQRRQPQPAQQPQQPMPARRQPQPAQQPQQPMPPRRQPQPAQQPQQPMPARRQPQPVQQPQQPMPARRQPQPVQQPQQRTVNDPTRQQQSTTSSRILVIPKAQPSNEDIVDLYIKRLEQQPVQNKNNQKVKK